MAKQFFNPHTPSGATVLVTGLLLLLSGLLIVGIVNIGYAQAAGAIGAQTGPLPAALPDQQTCTCNRQDTLDCVDFADRDAAQACFSQCLSEDGYDVHDLDRDNDGLACEIGDDTAQTAPVATPEPVECTCQEKNLSCGDFASQQEAQSCFNLCRSFSGRDYYGLDTDSDGNACEIGDDYSPFGPSPAQAESGVEATPVVEEEPVEGADNLMFNGNFEFGFYQVPQLGFEPPDVGNVPNNWGWYKSNTYGKVNIYNNEAFGLICRDDRGLARTQQTSPEDALFGPIPGVVYRRPNNSVSLHLQSTDQMDMRLGIYQTVNVVPGQDYRFTMSGTVQVQSGAQTLQPDDPEAPIEGQNHVLEISFDHTGGTDWRAVPLHRRNIWELQEQKLEFKVSEDDEDIAQIENYETIVRARSDKMTIFITGWRRWANWRTAIFTLDCVSLTPVGASGAVPAALQPQPVPEPEGPAQTPDGIMPESERPAQPAEIPTTGGPSASQNVDIKKNDVQPAAFVQPAPAPSQKQNTAASAAASIPFSGGILEKAGNSPLLIVVSIVVLVGLVGAGVWNIRRNS